MRYLALSLAWIASAAFAQDDWDDWGSDAWDEDQGLQWSGFLEGALGERLDSDPLLSDSTLRDAYRDGNLSKHELRIRVKDCQHVRVVGQERPVTRGVGWISRLF